MKTKEKNFEKDYSAIQQMKREDIVPPVVQGADKLLATSDDKMEIERGHKFDNLGFAKELQAKFDSGEKDIVIE